MNKTVRSNRIQEISGYFRCPECHSDDLHYHPENAICICLNCSASYITKNNVPVLLSNASKKVLGVDTSKETGQAMIEEYEQFRNAESKQSLKKRIVSWLRPPSIMLNYNPDLAEPHTQEFFNHNGDMTKVLNVGGGPRRYTANETILNLDAFMNVDVVGDAHNIPFQDNTFDSVFSVAVLEHVPEPAKVVKEMIRVLKPGGYIYSEIPFIFFFHGYPNDYQRLTEEGVKFLFNDLEDLEIGMTEGPTSAVLQSINILLNIYIPEKWVYGRKVFNGVFRWLFFPFKYLDFLVRKNKSARNLAGGFYVIAKKP